MDFAEHAPRSIQPEMKKTSGEWGDVVETMREK